MYSPSSDGGAAQAEAKTQAQLAQGTAAVNSQFSQFGNDFYNQAAKDYTNYATPQVDQQFRNTNNDLTYSLERNGLLNSGAAVQRRASLKQALNTNLGDIANTAQDQENTLRTNVANQKSSLLSQVEAGAAPSEVAQQAQAATANLRAPTALPPVGNMFSDWANTYLANMSANTYNPNTGNLWQLLGGGAGSGYGQPSSATIK